MGWGAAGRPSDERTRPPAPLFVRSFPSRLCPVQEEDPMRAHDFSPSREDAVLPSAERTLSSLVLIRGHWTLHMAKSSKEVKVPRSTPPLPPREIPYPRHAHSSYRLVWGGRGRHALWNPSHEGSVGILGPSGTGLNVLVPDWIDVDL
ncbi:hypothetical protein GQ53DRAFT_744992 [Thozetella sp. PMI_491]|nr:hypothetical protein GQ53DRAFT_744992 [Thozetella sp. PMI_491]